MKRKTQIEASNLLALRGYELLSEYIGSAVKITVKCISHGVTNDVWPSAILGGGGMRCCYAERKSSMMLGNKMMVGRKASDEAKKKMSESRKGIPRDVDAVRATAELNRGKKRTAKFSENQSAWLRDKSKNIEYIINRAATGKTAGKPGIFYMARVGNLIKFGSTNRTIDYRMSRLRTAEGQADLLLSAQVDDAGAYEAAMMVAHRSLWDRGEFFRMPTATLQPGVTPP